MAIEMSKFSIQFQCLFVSGYHGVFKAFKMTYMETLSIAGYCGLPLPYIVSPPYAFMSASIVWSNLAIALILIWSSLTKIFPSIIKSVSIFVISLECTTAIQNLPRHIYSSFFCVMFTPSDRIEALCNRTPMSTPIPAAEPLKIISIHNSVLALCKWNESIRLVKRLGNFVSKNTSFLHVLTSNESVLPAAFYHTIAPQLRRQYVCV